MGDPAHEIGVVMLQRRGMPRLDAEVAMLIDPRCRAVAEAMVPAFQRMARDIKRIFEVLGKANS